ncbi:MAG: glycosyltransferase [Mucinivorans sp.]
MRFSILIPSWNNLEFLKLCVRSFRLNSRYPHQIIIHVNQGSDGTLEWVKSEGLEYTYSEQNIGVCWALNGMRPLVKTDYIAFANDDMYALPDWDFYLEQEILRLGHKLFFLSSTLIQPRKFFCSAIIAPQDYGQGVEDFREADLLRDFATFAHPDWFGSTWPLNVVHRDTWDMVGGYSVEYSPGMYSDPDFSAKLWMAGVRYFKGISRSRLYHFEARSTARVTKNNGSRQFLFKWGITSSSFMRNVLRRGEPFDETKLLDINTLPLKKDILRSRLKRILESVKKTGNAKTLWQ